MDNRNTIKSITVFCGSRPGNDPHYMEYARKLGRTLASQGIQIVYGGAKVGLMGALADGALENNGKVIGVIPTFWKKMKEIPHKGLTKLIYVKSMHARKMKMYELSDGFIALPGGFGTMEEYFEILSWNKILELPYKPLGILNIDGFYDGLITFVDHLLRTEFINEKDKTMFYTSPDIDELLHMMRNDSHAVTTSDTKEKKELEKM